MPVHIIILLIIWACAMTLSIWALEVARMFARRAAKARKNPPRISGDAPSVALILPIKGIEDDTAENLRALLGLSYPRLRLLFAVESEDDPVVALIRQVTRQIPGKNCEIVVAGPATTRGQKIHNQLAAVARTTSADEVLVFMDADARPHDRWLPALLEPLDGPGVGASTGCRLYSPVEGEGSSRLANAQVCVINSSIAALLGPRARNQAWGGSMAIRRKNFFDFGVHEAWQQGLSDDYILTRQVKHVHKKAIRFAHACFVASEASFNWKSLFEFGPRQYKITRICAPRIWLAAVLGSLLYVAAFLYPVVMWIIDMIIGRPDHMLLVLVGSLYVVNWIRGWFLLAGSKAALPEQAGRLKSVAFWYTWGLPLAFMIDLVMLMKSAGGRVIEWRGIRYTMHSATRTTVHRAVEEVVVTPRAEPVSAGELIAK